MVQLLYSSACPPTQPLHREQGRLTARTKPLHTTQIILIDNLIPNHPNQNRGHEQQFTNLVFHYCIEHSRHSECGKHVYFCIQKDGEVKSVDEAGDVEGWEDGEDFFVVAGCDLGDLETLGDYVLVGYHDLVGSCINFFLRLERERGIRTALGRPVVPLEKERKPQRSLFFSPGASLYSGTCPLSP